MRRSELELHIDILKTLAHEGPSKITHIMYKANVWYDMLKKALDFLVQQNLVEKRIVRNTKTIYAITQKGLTALRYFRELRTTIPLVEDDREMPAFLF